MLTGAPDEYEVYRQSRAAYKEWDNDWTNNCNLNKPYYKNRLSHLAGTGKNKAIIAVAYGESMGKNLEHLKTFYEKGLDIICVDKAFKTLIENGIYPTYVVVADANIKYPQYGKGVDSSKSALLINVCGNHQWIKNWKGKIYFYVNVDNIGTQHKYSKLTGVQEMIPAASNVGNAVIVLCRTVLQYSQIFLLGYDYSWKSSGQYYGNEQHNEKKFSQNHIKLIDINDDLVCTSTNLDFSCRWLLTYMNRYKVNAINLSGQGILDYHSMNVPYSPTFRHGNAKVLADKLKEVKTCQN